MHSFIGLKSPWADLEHASFVVVPLPYDNATSWMPGARQAPRAILEASCQMELYDEETGLEPFRLGIHTLEMGEMPIDAEEALETARALVQPILQAGKVPVCLGGDHSMSIGPILEAHRHHGLLDILQIDAHTDLREEYQGSRLSHACAMRRVWHCGQVIQCGIRSMSREEAGFLEEEGARPIMARAFREDLGRAVSEAVERLSGRPLYITVDLDGFDPSLMPATGTPEPGGLGWYQVLSLLDNVIAKAPRLVGFDLVELAPVPGLHHPQFTAARLAYKIMAYAQKHERIS